MRKAMILLGKILFSATIAFTIMTVIFAAVSLAVGETRMDVMNVFQYLALCIATSTLQVLAFTELIFQKLRYSLRMLLFALPFLLILTGFAVVFGWFPVDKRGAWVLFFLSFFVALGIITVGFEVYYRAAGKRYDGLLGEYRNRKKHEKRG